MAFFVLTAPSPLWGSRQRGGSSQPGDSEGMWSEKLQGVLRKSAKHAVAESAFFGVYVGEQQSSVFAVGLKSPCSGVPEAKSLKAENLAPIPPIQARDRQVPSQSEKLKSVPRTRHASCMQNRLRSYQVHMAWRHGSLIGAVDLQCLLATLQSEALSADSADICVKADSAIVLPFCSGTFCGTHVPPFLLS